MSGRIPTWVLPGMLGGVILGGLLGYFLPDLMLSLGFAGKLFSNALRMLVVPLVMGSLIVGIGHLADGRRLGQISGLTVVYYLVTTLVAVLVAVVAVTLFKPGAGASIVGLDSIPNLPGTGGQSLTGILSTIFPENIVRAIIEGELLSVVVFTGLFALALTWLASRGRNIVTFFGEVNDAVIRLMIMIMYAAPVGAACLMGSAVAANRGSVAELLSSLGMYVVTIVVVLLVVGLIIFPLVMMAVSKRSVGSYMSNMATALTAAFATSSSAAAFPVTYDAVTDTNRVDSKVASVVLPLGLGLNMAATAAYLVVATMFAAQLYASQSPGFDLPWPNLIMVLVMASLVSLGTPGLPSAGFLLLTTTFAVAGLPPGALVATSLIFAVDWFVDRLRAAVNVCGDAVGAAAIADMSDEMRAAARVAVPRSQAGRDRGRPMPSDSREDRFAPRRGGRGGRVEQRPGRERTDRPERPERGDRGDRRPGTRQRFDERGRDRDRQDRPKPSPFEMPVSTTPVLDSSAITGADSPKPERPEPIERPQTVDRSESKPQPERPERFSRPDRAERGERPDRGDRRDRPDRRGRGRFGDRERQPRGDRGESRSDRLTREQIERELANVSAQIGTEEPSGPGPTTPSQMESPMTSEPIQASEPAPAEPRNVTRRFDMRELESQEPPAEIAKAERREITPLRERDELTAAEAEQAAETSEPTGEWGRGVKRLGKLPPAEASATDLPPNATPEPTSFSTENLEFGGRGRKKRPNG